MLDNTLSIIENLLKESDYSTKDITFIFNKYKYDTAYTEFLIEIRNLIVSRSFEDLI